MCKSSMRFCKFMKFISFHSSLSLLLRCFMLGWGCYLEHFVSCLRSSSLAQSRSETKRVKHQHSLLLLDVECAHRSSLILSGISENIWPCVSHFSYRIVAKKDRHSVSAICHPPQLLRTIIDDIAMKKYNRIQLFLKRHINEICRMNDLWMTVGSLRNNNRRSSSLPHWIHLFRHQILFTLSMISQYLRIKLQYHGQNHLSSFSTEEGIVKGIQELYTSHQMELDNLLQVTFQSDNASCSHVSSYLTQIYSVSSTFSNSLHRLMDSLQSSAERSHESDMNLLSGLMNEKERLRCILNGLKEFLANASNRGYSDPASVNFRDLLMFLF